MRQEVVTGEGSGDLDRCGAPGEVPSPVERCREERRQIMHDVPELSEHFSTVWAYGFGHLDHGPLDAATRAAGPSVVVAARRRQRRRTPSQRVLSSSWPSPSGDGCSETFRRCGWWVVRVLAWSVWVAVAEVLWVGRCCARSAGPHRRIE